MLHRHVAPDPSVPPPPVPELASPFGLRPADPDSDDTALVAAWMRLPALVTGWEQDWPDERWYDQLKAQVDGTYSRPYIILYRGEPCGYLEVARAAQDIIATQYEADPYDLVMHWAIAHPSMAGKGYILKLLPGLFRSVFEREPLCRRVVGEPDHKNTANCRVLDYIGFTFLGERQVNTNRRIAFYSLPRTPADMPKLL